MHRVKQIEFIKRFRLIKKLDLIYNLTSDDNPQNVVLNSASGVKFQYQELSRHHVV